MLIQIIIILFIIYIFTKMVKKFKKGELSLKEFILWSVLWIIIIIATILPKTTDIIANFFGVGRGYDLSVYVSIVVLFYLMFRIMVKIDKMDRNITKIVREMAIREEIKKLRN